MATKENELFSKKFLTNSKNHSDNGNQYSNFNLNQSHKYANLNLVHKSFSNSKNVKNFVDTVTHKNLESKKSWNKLSKELSLKTSKNAFLNHKIEESQNCWKNEKNISLNQINKNSSTLSLHIAAYENFVESSSKNEVEELPSKECDTPKLFGDSFTTFQDRFEFPRQMEGIESTTAPEIMQFKASQKLLIPKQSSVSTTENISHPSENLCLRNLCIAFISSLGFVAASSRLNSLLLRKPLFCAAVSRSGFIPAAPRCVAFSRGQFCVNNFQTRQEINLHSKGYLSCMSSMRLIPLIFRGFVFLPQRSSSSSSSTFLLQPFRSFASYAPRSRKHSKSSKKHNHHHQQSAAAPSSTKFDENQIIPDALGDLPQAERIYRRPEYHFNSEHGKDGVGNEYPASTFSKDEREIGIPFLKKVVGTLEDRGQQFVLPWSDESAIESILGISRELTTATGVLPEFLFDAFTQKPELFAAITREGNKCIEIFDCLCDMCGFSIQDTIRMFGSYTPELLETNANEISQRLSCFLGVGIKAGKSLGRIVRKCPAILFASDSQQMIENVEAMGGFFSRAILPKIVANDPEIVLKNFEQIEANYEYIYYHMRCEPEEFVESKRWSQLSLEEVMNRHQFLVKTGKYELPDPKKPQLKMENPPIHRIFDTKDDAFALHVAKVSLEEWLMYKELAEKLEGLEDKERPFERIKPSQRKAYERRMKETKEQQDYVFEA